jgi:hypothetical protein
MPSWVWKTLPHVAVDEIVLVTPVAVTHEVGVVLEDRQLPGNALFADLLLREDLQILENPLSRLVVDDQLARRRALGRRVFGVATGVLVETGAVLEEDVEEVLRGDQLLEEKADRLLHGQRLPPLGGEDDAVFGLDAVDPFLHATTRLPRS